MLSHFDAIFSSDYASGIRTSLFSAARAFTPLSATPAISCRFAATATSLRDCRPSRRHYAPSLHIRYFSYALRGVDYIAGFAIVAI